MLQAAIDGSDEELRLSANEVGYLKGDESLSYEKQMLSLLRMVTEPFMVQSYDYGQSDLARRMNECFLQMRLQNHSMSPVPWITDLQQNYAMTGNIPHYHYPITVW